MYLKIIHTKNINSLYIVSKFHIENKEKIHNSREIEIAASTALRYSDSPKNELSNVRVRIGQLKEKEVKELQVSPLDDKILNQLRICF